jgi:2-polyprenyl-6-methoxyphenol hydroxylase-like FAD-dependent oxidoreductase
MDTEVLIVGAGPVGLTLAIDLGKRGVRCTLIEKNAAPSGYPKMERCNPRTMEIFRRLGLAQTIRDAGYPPSWPMDKFLILSMSQPPLMQVRFPTVAEACAKIAAVNDGSLPLEPYQIISQYTLEPLLKSVAESLPTVTVRFGCELESYKEAPDGTITSRVRAAEGIGSTITSQYLVGCDGGASTVRRQLGFGMEGEGALLTMHQAMFRCDDLWEHVSVPRGRHFHRVDPHWTFLIVQDSTRHFTVHSIVEEEGEMRRRFEDVVGAPVDYEMLHVNKWTQRLLLSTGYAVGRVFIAGDACHLVIPTGGLGYNTGVGDAINLGWKLAAMLQGWGGPNLLGSYEAERRPVGARNVEASGRGNAARALWREASAVWSDADTPAGEEARARLIKVASTEFNKSSEVIGAELGYRYAGSPIVVAEAGEEPPNPVERYVPTTWPGARLPHVWERPGVSVHDRIGDGYTLLRLGTGRDDATALAQAFRGIGAPFQVIDIEGEAPREVYGRDYLLVRPDLHVVWRGDALPPAPEDLVRRVTGH